MKSANIRILGKTGRIITALLVGAGGPVGAYKLLLLHQISEPSFIILVCVAIIGAIVIGFVDRIHSFSLRDLRVEMAKVEAARQDVEDREREVRRIALTLAEVTMFLAAFHRRLGSDESHAIEQRWLESRIKQLLSEITAAPAEEAKVFRFISAVHEMDLQRSADPEQSQHTWDRIWEDISREIETKA